MAARGTIMFQDDAVVTVGQTRGWKVAFGYSTKGTIVVVYKVAADGGTATTATEVPLLGNGKADVNAVTALLSASGVALNNALKQVIGA